jgi:hypothetical protein
LLSRSQEELCVCVRVCVCVCLYLSQGKEAGEWRGQPTPSSTGVKESIELCPCPPVCLCVCLLCMTDQNNWLCSYSYSCAGGSRAVAAVPGEG